MSLYGDSICITTVVQIQCLFKWKYACNNTKSFFIYFYLLYTSSYFIYLLEAMKISSLNSFSCTELQVLKGPAQTPSVKIVSTTMH